MLLLKKDISTKERYIYTCLTVRVWYLPSVEVKRVAVNSSSPPGEPNVLAFSSHAPTVVRLPQSENQWRREAHSKHWFAKEEIVLRRPGDFVFYASIGARKHNRESTGGVLSDHRAY